MYSYKVSVHVALIEDKKCRHHPRSPHVPLYCSADLEVWIMPVGRTELDTTEAT